MENTHTEESSQDPKKKRVVVRFSAGCDIILLKLILEHNPYDSSDEGSSWKALAPLVSTACSKQFTQRAVKERAEYLINKYKAQDLQDLKKSGTEEEFSEREELLSEVLRLREEYKVPPKGDRPTKKEVEEGKMMRQLAARTMCSDEVDLQDSEGGTAVDADALLFEVVEDDNRPSSSLPATVEVVDLPPSTIPDTSSTNISTLTPPPRNQSSNMRTPLLTSTPHPKRKKRDTGISEQVREMREKERELEMRRLEVEMLKAQNESRRIAMAEAKAQKEEERMDELLKSQSAKDEKILTLLGIMIKKFDS